MFCKNCGAEQPEGTRFCSNCGSSLSDMQPEYRAGGTYPQQKRPSTYLALSILVTIFCCLPFGIIGIVYASKVESCWSAGRIGEACRNSRMARNWSIAGLSIGLLWWIVYLALIILGVSWATWWDDSAYYTTCLL